MRPAAALLAAVCGLALGACGNTLQDQPISHSTLEQLIVAPYPVYWLGSSFSGLQITEGIRDPSGSFSLQYGDCIRGGQGFCIAPLRIVTSPDNSFVPGGSTPSLTRTIRGVPARVSESGKAVAIATAGVVVSIYADTPAMALVAAGTMVPINAPASPGEPLPLRLPDTGYGSTPLPTQMPPAVRPLG